MRKLVKSFYYALSGILYCILNERNMRIHTVCMFYMYFFLFYFDFFEITRTQFAVILIANALVLGSELINTAIEKTVDLFSEEHTEFGKIAKDSAAGAVLIFAVFSVLVGVAIMWQPEAFHSLFNYFSKTPMAIGLLILSLVVSAIFIFYNFKSKEKE